MKKSIKTLATALVVAIAAAAPMQSHAIDFGIRAGLDVTTPGDLKTGGFKADLFKPGCGFHAGVVADIDLPSNLFFEPGMYLVYRTTGTDVVTDDALFGKPVKADLSLRQFGLMIPLRLGYNIDLKVCDLRIFTGPSFGVGLSGKWHSGGESQDAYEDEGLSRFNVGWNLGAGVKISRFYVGMDYTFGLNDRYKADESSWRQGTFAVSLGYYL